MKGMKNGHGWEPIQTIIVGGVDVPMDSQKVGECAGECAENVSRPTGPEKLVETANPALVDKDANEFSIHDFYRLGRTGAYGTNSEFTECNGAKQRTTLFDADVHDMVALTATQPMDRSKDAEKYCEVHPEGDVIEFFTHARCGCSVETKCGNNNCTSPCCTSYQVTSTDPRVPVSLGTIRYIGCAEAEERWLSGIDKEYRVGWTTLYIKQPWTNMPLYSAMRCKVTPPYTICILARGVSCC